MKIEMGDSTPIAIQVNEVEVNGVKLKVYLLDNGERVIEEESFRKLFEIFGAIPKEI